MFLLSFSGVRSNVDLFLVLVLVLSIHFLCSTNSFVCTESSPTKTTCSGRVPSARAAKARQAFLSRASEASRRNTDGKAHLSVTGTPGYPRVPPGTRVGIPTRRRRATQLSSYSTGLFRTGTQLVGDGIARETFPLVKFTAIPMGR
eukprot:650057-Rhodomonas_salina.1